MKEALKNCASHAHFIKLAEDTEKTTLKRGIEFNVPATIITVNGFQKERMKRLEPSDVPAYIALLETCVANADTCAEEGMVQIALLNRSINPGSAFITTAVDLGWRYRDAKGFHKGEA